VVDVEAVSKKASGRKPSAVVDETCDDEACDDETCDDDEACDDSTAEKGSRRRSDGLYLEQYLAKKGGSGMDQASKRSGSKKEADC
jgi:hypothetical protein